MMQIWLLIVALLAALPAAAQGLAPRAVAVTFDDLPFVSVPADDDAALGAMTGRLLHALEADRVPAVGFVNEAKLYRDGRLDPARVALLEQWIRAGCDLGNHTYSHLSFNRVPLDAYEADVLQGEAVTRPLLQNAGRSLHWFRPPFLHLGANPAAWDALQAWLAARGYAVAPVTVNSGEWVFAVAYARALAQDDAEATRRIGAAYVPYMESAFARAEQQALELFGRPIPQVLVLHANALNADRFGALAAMLKQRGYRFVTLDDALRDSAYTSPLDFSGPEGESWLERWSRRAGLRPELPPALPAFVTQWAGPAAYRGD